MWVHNSIRNLVKRHYLLAISCTAYSETKHFIRPSFSPLSAIPKSLLACSVSVIVRGYITTLTCENWWAAVDTLFLQQLCIRRPFNLLSASVRVSDGDE